MIFVNQEDFIIFYLLPYIITSQRIRKRRSNDDQAERPSKLSLDERRETFILHIHVCFVLNFIIYMNYNFSLL